MALQTTSRERSTFIDRIQETCATRQTGEVCGADAYGDALPKQHTLARSVALHLAPGIATLVVYIAAHALLAPYGVPATLALLLAVVVAALPIELGHLLLRGYRDNQRWSLKGVVVLGKRRPVWQYIALILPLLIWSFLCYGLLTPISEYLSHTIFGWLPVWFLRDGFTHVSRPWLLLTVVVLLVVNGVIAPVVEEWYFRGYLLPRLKQLGPWAPLLNVTLFTVYHFWQPWLYPTLLVALLPMVVAVWLRRDVRLGIGVHCVLNLLGGLASLGLLLGAH